MEDMLDTVVQRRLDDQRNLQMTFEIRWFDITQMIDKVNISKVNGYPIDAMGYRHILVELICKLLVLNDYEVVQYLDHEIFHKVGFDTVVLIFRAKPQHSRHLIDFPEETP